VVSDVEFIHSNSAVQDCVFVYCSAIGYLLNNAQSPSRSETAFETASDLAKSELGNESAMEGSESISALQCLQKAQELSDRASATTPLHQLYQCQENELSIKHAMTIAFFWLLQAKNYSDNLNDFYQHAMKETLNLGGDTNANAAVVGGLIGALVGIRRMPRDMIEKLLQFDCTTEGEKRDDFLSTKRHAIKNIDSLIMSMPKQKLVIVEERERD